MYCKRKNWWVASSHRLHLFISIYFMLTAGMRRTSVDFYFSIWHFRIHN